MIEKDDMKELIDDVQKYCDAITELHYNYQKQNKLNVANLIISHYVIGRMSYMAAKALEDKINLPLFARTLIQELVDGIIDNSNIISIIEKRESKKDE